MTRRAVFLDRDGTLNTDIGYAHDLRDLMLVPGAAAAVARFTRSGFLTVIVTNQSGIARGLFDENQMLRFNAALCRRLSALGGRIDLVRFCPHHPDITGPCRCRKPSPGMLLDAISRHGIDPARSILVGDSPRDVAAAERAGVRGYLFDGADLDEFCRQRGLYRAG